jgi:hypothetical protein
MTLGTVTVSVIRVPSAANISPKNMLNRTANSHVRLNTSNTSTVEVEIDSSATAYQGQFELTAKITE